MKIIASIRNFARGFVDVFGRGKEPEGSFADSRNLIPTKLGSLETVHGYAAANLSSHKSSTTALPTGFPDATGTGTFAITKVLADPFPYSSETPSAYDGRVYWVEDEDGTKHIMLDTWFHYQYHGDSDAKVDTAYDGFILLDETKTIAYSADVTIAGTTIHTITITNATAKGLSAVADYYTNWRIEWYDVTGSTEYALVTNYAWSSAASGTATFTTLEDIGSDFLKWTDYATPDTLTLRRWFHMRTAFTPAFAIPPGKAFESQGIVRGCGGAASTTGYDPWWCGYINRTYFNGVAGGSIVYRGTYVDSMETLVYSDTIVDAVLKSSQLAVVTTEEHLPQAYYGLAYTLEYDGYQESPLQKESGNPNNVTDDTRYIQFSPKIQFCNLSKRVTAINIYARQTIGGVIGSYYFIRRLALHNLTAAEILQWEFQSVDTPASGAEKAAGYFVIDATTGVGGDPTKTLACLNGSDWNSRGGTYFDRTGRNENDENYVEHNIVNWQYTENLAGRRFFGNFYDQTALETVTDWVRFTPFGQGISNYDIIPSDRLNFEFEASMGDPGSVKGLIADKGFLYTFKDASVLSSYINADPTTWVHQVVSNQDGLYAVKSLVRLPEGGVCFADVDHYKILTNQRVMPLTTYVKDTYYALTGKSTIISWFDKIDGAVCFNDGVSTTHYRGYKTAEGMAWFKVVLPTAQYPEFVATERDGSIIFTNGATSFPGLFKWARATYVFGSGAIIPYLKTTVMVPDESAHVLVDKFVLTKSGNASTGTLQNRIYLDGSVVQSFAAEDKTKTTLFQKMGSTSVRQGRRVQVEYNYHTTGESSTAAKLQLDGIDVYGQVIQPPEKSI
jgi:hypothetical protein